MAIENPLFWYLFSRFIIQEKFRIIIYQLSVLDCDALSSHQASFALSASDPQYPTPKTHKADGSFAEDASVGYRVERVNPSLDSFLAEDVQGDFVDLSFFLDDPASGLSLSGMELISASINWVASPSSVRFQLSLIRVISFVRPLTLSMGVLVDDLESTSPRVAVLWLLIDRVPTPCSGMELLWFLSDGVCRIFCSNVRHATARATTGPSSGTLFVFWSWRSCWCSVFWHELVNSSFRACGGCRMYPLPPS